MPATLPWPKIVDTPAKNGCSTPSRLVCCCVRNSTIACPIVRRRVVGMMFLGRIAGSAPISRSLPDIDARP